MLTAQRRPDPSGILYIKWTDPPTHIVGMTEDVFPALLDDGREPVDERTYAKLADDDKERTPVIVRREQRVVLSDEQVRSKRPLGVEDLALTITQAAGDTVALTAVIRDLHKAHPGRFRTVVQTAFPELLENNPYITPDSEIVQPRRIDCDWMGGAPGDGHRHFTQAWRDDVQHRIGVPIPLTSVWGDIHLSEVEKQWPADLLGDGPRPFAIVNAGVKPDWRTKGWGTKNYQAVVDHFAGRIEFVQIGKAAHEHQPLRGVNSLLDRTGIRDLCRLVYWSDLVVCPITLVLHLCAAIPRRDGTFRPCVVLTGGIEPTAQTTYDGHVVLNTVGALPCCSSFPCGKMNLPPSRTADFTNCTNPVHYIADEWVGKCFDLIKPQRVIDAIETYIAGGMLPVKSDQQSGVKIADLQTFSTRSSLSSSLPT